MSQRHAMLLWKRYVITGTFFFLYTIVTFYLSSLNNDCHTQPQNPVVADAPPCDPQAPRGDTLLARLTQLDGNNGANDFPVHAQNVNARDTDRLNAAPGFDPQDFNHDLNTNLKQADTVIYNEHKNYIELLPPDQLLRPEFVPNVVFYVWCGKRWFEYHNYMSVVSVIKIMRPDSLIFYYDEEPVDDFWIYNTWFKELKESYAFFMPIKLKPDQNGCQSFATPSVDFIYDNLYKYGGIYVNEQTIFNAFPLTFRNYSFMYALNEHNKYSFVLNDKKAPIRELLKNPLMRPYKTHHIKCVSESVFNKNASEICVTRSTAFFPKDIWTRKSNFANLIRRHFYGSADIRVPVPNYDTLIPNIAHIVWIGGGEMDQLFYMCVLSLIYVAEVDIVYIHGDLPPSGANWKRIKDHPKLRLIYREVPKLVFGTEVNILSHVTDVWRVDFMIKYGGIYVDTDTSFVRPLDREIRGYDAVGTYDWTHWNHPFPDTINFGVAIGKRNAKYWHLFQDSMRWFIDSDWSWNGLRQPYRIQERHPELVKIDPRLQVTCFELKCHPTWWPNYNNESIHHLNSPSITNWKEQMYAFHWTLPTPPELQSFDNLLQSDTLFAEVGRYIFQKAGVLQSDNKTVIHPNGERFVYSPKNT